LFLMLLQEERNELLSEAKIEAIAVSNRLTAKLRYSQAEAEDATTPGVSSPHCNPDLHAHCPRHSKLNFFSKHIWVPFM
jgi:hypothetical protein